MLKKHFGKLLILLLVVGIQSSCIVSKKKYEALDKSKKRVEQKNRKLIEEGKEKDLCIDSLQQNLKSTLEEYNDMKNNLVENNARKNTEIDQLNSELLNISEDNQKLKEKLESSLADVNREKERISMLRKDLQGKNEELVKLQSAIDDNKKHIEELKTNISDALVAFKGEGLNVHQKEGKVYVSMDEKLLFKSGSATVGTKGIKAIKKIALALEQYPDIEIMIEGHTDNVGDPKFNWDLSVRRATSIINIIQSNSKIEPSRLTASGRGMYHPLDPSDTKEARQKNRRTEIILTPKLDKLYELLK